MTYFNRGGTLVKKEAGFQVLIQGNRCFRCDHEWRPQSLDERPAVCPKCKNPYWDRPRQDKGKKFIKEDNKDNVGAAASENNNRRSFRQFCNNKR